MLVTLASTLGTYSSAYAWTVRTQSMAQHPQGYLQCKVVATSKVPINVVATIVNRAKTNVTEFGYATRARNDGGFEAEETAGSFDADSDLYSCKVRVTGARRKDVAVSLTSHDADGNPLATVAPRGRSRAAAIDSLSHASS